MRVRLLRKLADQLDGVDVSGHVAGDVIELTPREAGLLIAEGWAVAVSADTPVRRRVVHRRSTHSSSIIHTEAADATERRTIERLREVRKEMEERQLDEQESRRAEDRIREELRDSRAKTVTR